MSDLGMSTTSDVTKCKECGVLASQNNTINKTADEQTFKTQKDAQPNQQTSDLGTCCCCEYYGIPCRQISTNESETTKQKNRILFSGIKRQMVFPRTTNSSLLYLMHCQLMNCKVFQKGNITRMPSPKKKHMSVTLMDGLLLAHSFSLVVASDPRNKKGNMEKVKK